MHVTLPSFKGDYYPFLSWLATHVPPDGLIIECGTYEGRGAFALGYDGTRVHTCDPHGPHQAPLVDDNITYTRESALDLAPALLSSADLIYLDISHNGRDETAFVGQLAAAGFRGLLVCDDIDMNAAMRAFWADLPSPKHTIRVGEHDTTIGLLSFSSEHTIES